MEEKSTFRSAEREVGMKMKDKTFDNLRSDSFFQALSIGQGGGSHRWKGSKGGIISSERDILPGVR